MHACMHDLRIVRVKQNNNIALMDKICNPSIDMQLAVVVFFFCHFYTMFVLRH
jgi:hypothetical protein